MQEIISAKLPPPPPRFVHALPVPTGQGSSYRLGLDDARLRELTKLQIGRRLADTVVRSLAHAMCRGYPSPQHMYLIKTAK